MPSSRGTLAAVAATAAMIALVAGCAPGGQVVSGVAIKGGQFIERDVEVSDQPMWWRLATENQKFQSVEPTDTRGGDRLCESFGLEGKQVTVQDASGTTVAVGTLSEGTPSELSGWIEMSKYSNGTASRWGRVTTEVGGVCTFSFSANLSPASDFYSVSIAGVPGEVQYTKEEILEGIELSL